MAEEAEVQDDESWEPQETELSVEENEDFLDIVEDDDPEPEPEADPEQSGGVQKRINELTRQKHEAERRASDTEARSAAELAQLRSRLEGVETGVHQKQNNDFKEKYAGVRDRLKEATENGDTDSMVGLQEEMSDMRTTVRLQEMHRQNQQQQQQAQQQQAQQQQAQQQQQQAPQAAHDWWQRNAWFNTPGNKAESAYAKEVDLDLEASGFDKNSAEYYTELDNRLQKAFPVLYDSPGAAPAAPKSRAPIAPAKGGGSAQPKDGRIRLTRNEMKIAKEFGLTSEAELREYAKEIKAQGNQR